MDKRADHTATTRNINMTPEQRARKAVDDIWCNRIDGTPTGYFETILAALQAQKSEQVQELERQLAEANQAVVDAMSLSNEMDAKLRAELDQARKSASDHCARADTAEAAVAANCREIARLTAELAAARHALEHCRQRPHEHNPSPDWIGPTHCEVIDRALANPSPAADELLKDRERLDWLQSLFHSDDRLLLCRSPYPSFYRPQGMDSSLSQSNVREAIDAARAQQKHEAP